jgi:hypothetical protein
MLGPTVARMASISSGEQTMARAPALTARDANATALSSAGLANPILNKSAYDSEVRIVTAVMSV